MSITGLTHWGPGKEAPQKRPQWEIWGSCCHLDSSFLHTCVPHQQGTRGLEEQIQQAQDTRLRGDGSWKSLEEARGRTGDTGQ